MFAFGIIEIIAISLFCIMLLAGTILDRAGNTHYKWVFLLIIIGITGVWFWNDFTFAEIWTSARTWEFWRPVAYYGVVGILYSMFESVYEVIRARRSHAKEWAAFLTRSHSIPIRDADGNETFETGRNGNSFRANREMRSKDILNDPTVLNDDKERILSNYILSSGNRRESFIKIKMDATASNLEATINRGTLIDFIGAWVTFWPFYAVARIVGDLLVELWTFLGNLFANLGARFVKAMFADTFKT